MPTTVAGGSGLEAQIAALSSKVAAVDAAQFEAAGDRAGYGTTQQIVLDNLSQTFAQTDTSAYNYWANVCSSIYMNLPPDQQYKYDNAGFTQGNVVNTPAPFFGNTGITGYWADQATAAATGVKSWIVGDTPKSPDGATGLPWMWIIFGAVAIWLLFFM